MSDVNVDPGDGSVTTDQSGEGRDRGEIEVNQTVNQAQAQSNAQQQQQQQGFVPVTVTPVTPGQTQFQGGPSILIPLDSHVQAQGLLSQLQALLGL